VNWYKKSQTSFDDFETESKWIPVESSFITDVAYHEPMKLFEIRIKDKINKIHEYTHTDVPKNVFEDFMRASSKGQFYNAVIKKNYSLAQKTQKG